MEFVEYIQRKKECYSSIINFFESIDDYDIELHNLFGLFEERNIFQQEKEIREILLIISKIAANHHRDLNFYDKLEKIFRYIFQKSKSSLSSSEIIKIYEDDKRILLLFLEKNLIQPEKDDINFLIEKKSLNGFQYSHYLYSGLKQYIDESRRKQLEEEIIQEYGEKIDLFEQKCRIGENDSIICKLIREDSVEEFISYVTRNKVSLSSTIKDSIYETNSFLLNKNTDLIQYAVFFGSIQIFQYLAFNQVGTDGMLFLYAIHSNNPVLIHLLEEKKAHFSNSILVESIKCHHNSIGEYIQDNLLDPPKETKNNNDELYKHFQYVEKNILECYNYFFYPNNIDDIISREIHKYGFNISNLCFSFTKITIPSITTIGENAFFNCKSIEHIIIPSSVKYICDKAFQGCSSLIQIKIPNSVVSIGFEAFAECSKLKQIEIPSSVNKIEEATFLSCHSIEEIILPSSITHIDEKAFCDCISLVNISIPPSIKVLKKKIFKGCISLKEITIPSSVKIIKKRAFDGCSSLQTVSFELPSSLIEIGDFAFKNCNALEIMNIPNQNVKIGEDALPNNKTCNIA